MVRFLYEEGKNVIGVKISGKNFDALKECMKEELRFSFHSGFFGTPEISERSEKVWTASPNKLLESIPYLLEIEDFEYDEEMILAFLPKKETKKYRIPLDRSLLKYDPLGEFQEKGIKKLLTQNRLMLGWEMGLGKTFTIISALNHLVKYDKVDSLMIVAPSESIYNFKRELLKLNSFGLTDDDFYIADAENRDPMHSGKKILMMTYRTFLMINDDAYKNSFKEWKHPVNSTGKNKGKKKSLDYRKSRLDFSNWGTDGKRMIILDESHFLKNLTSRQSKVLHLNKEHFEFRYLLTGTPDPNGVEGYYSQMKFLDEGIIGEDYYEWLPSIAKVGTKFSQWGIAYYKEQGVKNFMQKIQPWISREFTEGNIKLPELIIKRNYCGLSKKQREIYEYLIVYTLEILKEQNGKIEPKEVKNNFPFILQALDNPSLLKGKINKDRNPTLFDLVEKWKFSDHSKLEISDSILERNASEGHKTIIWSGHPLTLDELSIYYKKYNPVVIHGRMNIPEGYSRTEYKDYLLEEFKKNPERKILLASIHVLQAAVNIVEARRTLYFDRPITSPVGWMQSRKRNHRIGQTEDVITNVLIFDRTIEERFDRRLEQKDNLNDQLCNVDSLSQEEWKALFLGDTIFE